MSSPSFPWYKLISCLTFLLISLFSLFKISFLYGEWDVKQKVHNDVPFYKWLSGPIMLSNMLGPDIHLCLGQILAYQIWACLVIFCFWGRVWNHNSYSVFSKQWAFKAPPMFWNTMCEHSGTDLNIDFWDVCCCFFTWVLGFVSW